MLVLIGIIIGGSVVTLAIWYAAGVLVENLVRKIK